MRPLLLILSVMVAAAATPAEAATPCKLKPKQVVERFTDLFYGQLKVREAFETWVAPDYIQHNPLAPDGRDAAIALLEPYFKSQPGLHYTIERIIGDGKFVAVHSHGQSSPTDRGAAVVDIFRVENCRIAEHWDVYQPVPEKSANPHPMF